LPQNDLVVLETPSLNKQEKSKEHEVVSSLRDTLVFLILLGRCETQLLQATTSNSPHALSLQNQKYFGDTNAWVQGFLFY
jgi:hypothetical protein